MSVRDCAFGPGSVAKGGGDGASMYSCAGVVRFGVDWFADMCDMPTLSGGTAGIVLSGRLPCLRPVNSEPRLERRDIDCLLTKFLLLRLSFSGGGGESEASFGEELLSGATDMLDCLSFCNFVHWARRFRISSS